MVGEQVRGIKRGMGERADFSFAKYEQLKVLMYPFKCH
jgi:hypothetical protein